VNTVVGVIGLIMLIKVVRVTVGVESWLSGYASERADRDNQKY
jgi:hypothetical protein